MSEEVAQPFSVKINSPQSCGVDSGEYCAIWSGPDMPGDQRYDDACSACFETTVLQKNVVIGGLSTVQLLLMVDKPVAHITVRLNDVWPDGAVTRITYGILNLCHYQGHEHAEPLVPGKNFRAVLELDDIAYTIPAGHRLRLAISTACWPLIWPAPESATIDILEGEILLHDLVGVECPVPEFLPAEAAPMQQTETVRKSTNSRKVETNQTTGRQITIIQDDFGIVRDVANGLEYGGTALETWSIEKADPCRQEEKQSGYKHCAALTG